ncbi:hypothetical protein DPMN_184781 [Dreissena polymorpha]|uniref:Uncharacterized protein n=1 Tax=Dreissena polymorpha TaxID=45954 RepID=A0A9D4DJC8_DREPO|nr:hypothetical protein DPMN_184781 [Dreissena polymorpha]
MPKNQGSKRKERNSSGNNDGINKQCKQRGPSGDLETSVSDVLRQANSVLYASDSDIKKPVDNCEVFVSGGNSVSDVRGRMASDGGQSCINALTKTIQLLVQRIASMEKKLDGIQSLEKKVTDFEKEVRKVWIAIEDQAKATEERVIRLEDRVELADMGTSLISTRVSDLERQCDELHDEVTYPQSQTMRNNLIFTNITEDNATGSEPAEAEGSYEVSSEALQGYGGRNTV